jgi:hypothetical protein
MLSKTQRLTPNHLKAEDGTLGGDVPTLGKTKGRRRAWRLFFIPMLR